MVQYHAITGSVWGRVQGVGYRYYAKSRAQELGLVGWVRNLPDGRVEFMVQGTPELLERFMHYLRLGPTGSQVDGAAFQGCAESQEIEGFEIRG
jgi:acylphosphatase